jgi:uncharacterized protein (TIGR02117 family)
MANWLFGLVMAPIILAGLYAAAGFGLGAWPDGDPPADGPIRLAIIANEFHSDLVMPAEDWRDLLHLPPDIQSVAIGWGDRAFYLETPNLADLKLSTALTALIGTDEAVLHVDLYRGPVGGPTVHPLPVTAEQKDQLETYLRAAFLDGPDGLPERLAHAGYGSDDAFYRARGHWSPFLTCNEFLARGLRAAGIRTGHWSPFTGGVTAYLPAA